MSSMPTPRTDRQLRSVPGRQPPRFTVPSRPVEAVKESPEMAAKKVALYTERTRIAQQPSTVESRARFVAIARELGALGAK